MKKFKDLLTYIESRNMVAQEQITSFVTNAELQLSGEAIGQNGINAAHKSYLAVYEVENYEGNADALLAHFASWIFKNGQSETERDMELPSFDIEIVNDHTVDVMVQIDFEERILLVKDQNGEFEFSEEMYRLADPQIDVAESFDIETEI